MAYMAAESSWSSTSSTTGQSCDADAVSTVSGKVARRCGSDCQVDDDCAHAVEQCDSPYDEGRITGHVGHPLARSMSRGGRVSRRLAEPRPTGSPSWRRATADCVPRSHTTVTRSGGRARARLRAPHTETHDHGTHPLVGDQTQDFSPSGAKRHPHADFARALCDRIGDSAVDADGRKQREPPLTKMPSSHIINLACPSAWATIVSIVCGCATAIAASTLASADCTWRDTAPTSSGCAP